MVLVLIPKSRGGLSSSCWTAIKQEGEWTGRCCEAGTMRESNNKRQSWCLAHVVSWNGAQVGGIMQHSGSRKWRIHSKDCGWERRVLFWLLLLFCLHSCATILSVWKREKSLWHYLPAKRRPLPTPTVNDPCKSCVHSGWIKMLLFFFRVQTSPGWGLWDSRQKNPLHHTTFFLCPTTSTSTTESFTDTGRRSFSNWRRT